MALYRNVQVSFWTDAKIVNDFSLDDTYFYLYLFTNPHTNLCGCYELVMRQIAYETKYSVEKVKSLIERLSNVHKVIKYCKETNEVLLINWHKYNWTASPKCTTAVTKEVKAVKCPEFKAYLTAAMNGDDPVSDISEYGISDEPVVEPKPVKQKPDVLTEKRFEAFWTLYPKKQGKGAAKKSWDKINPNAELFDKIMFAIQANIDHNRQWQKDRGQYIPNPSTWLNQERWEDDFSGQDDYFTRELKKMGGVKFE